MASLIPKNGTLLNCAQQAPAPQKDYCQILVKNGKVIFRWWKITMRKNTKSKPGEILDTYEDFSHDSRCHSEIHRCFGKNMLDYVKALVDGHVDYLPRLPRNLLIEIIRKMDLEDVNSLSLTNKMFYELCNSDDLWECIYHDNCETPITEDLRSLAEGLGWKKLFFTNKLQLQMQLRRQAKSKQEAKAHEQMAFMTEDDPDDDY